MLLMLWAIASVSALGATGLIAGIIQGLQGLAGRCCKCLSGVARLIGYPTTVSPSGCPSTQLSRLSIGSPGSQQSIDGQARLLGDPRVFTDPARGQIFHYAGDWEFHGGSPSMEGSRAAFVLELRRVLAKDLWDQPPATIRARLDATHDFATSKVAGGTSESVGHAAASDASTAKLSDPTRRKGKSGRRKR
mmetsp:Transcript_474/g.938  ORF Transcript_474/g.938 Transcript_474/m.938 type:complete len:191 (-) Transcript_474:191-763(-)